MGAGPEEPAGGDRDSQVVNSFFRIIIEDPSYGEPEERLWLSVMMQALSDSLSEAERPAIMEWILSEDFETVCDFCKLDHEKMTRLWGGILIEKKPRSLMLAKRLRDDILYRSRRVAAQ